MSRRGIPQCSGSREVALQKFLRIDCKSGKIGIAESHQFFNQMLCRRPPLPNSCFSTLLSALIKCEHFSVAISFYKRLNVSGLLGLRSDIFILSILLNCYSSMKLGWNSGYSVIGLVLKNGYRPNISIFNSLVKGLCSEVKVAEAVGLLSKMLRLGSCSPDVITYNTVINALCKTGNVKTALDVIVRCKAVPAKEGYRSRTVSYTLIDGSCIEWPMFDAKGRDVRFRPDYVSYSCLIEGLCLEEKVVEAVGLFREMLRLGYPPDIVTYNSIINGLCKTGNVTTALKLHRVMVSSEVVAAKEKCSSGTVSYTLIDGSCIEWPKVDAKGRHVKFSPNVVSYSCLIDWLGRLGMDEEAKYLLNEMIGRGIHPNVVTYSVVINTLCKHGKVEEATRILEVMTLRGQLPNTITYSTIVDGYCSIGKYETAMNLCKEMKSRGIVANSVTISTLLKGLFLLREVEDAMILFESMKKMDGSGVCGPNEVTYTTMIDGLCKEGLVSKAEEFFLEMQENGISLDNHVYSSLIDGLCKQGHVDKAQKLFSEMLANAVSPNVVVYSALINGLCKKGDIDMAKELFLQMQNRGIFLDVESYNILIDGLYRSGNVEEANTVLEKMIEQRIFPNAMTFNVIMNNLGKKGEQTARNVINMTESCGYVCDVASYNALIHGCCRARKLEDAYNLLAEMEAKGCSPNITTYSTLIRGFAHANASERVKDLTQKMHNIRISSKPNATSALLESINMDDETQ